MKPISRRSFLNGCSGVALSALAGCELRNPRAAFDNFIAAQMRRQNIAGLSVAVIRDNAVALANGYGLANIER